MVLSANATASFFEQDQQMGLPHDTVVRLQAEGIVSINDLAEFDSEAWKQVADNFRKSGGMIPDPAAGAAPGAMIPAPPIVFGAKSQKRLNVASDLVRYYDTVGREPTAGNMQWLQVMRNFEIQWKALKAKADDDIPDVPKITKALPVMKWTESFKDFLARVIGARTIPLSYVIRSEAGVPVAVPPLATNQPYSAVHGSVEDELVARSCIRHCV